MDHTHGSTIRSSAAYQVMLVTLLSVNFGIVFFDRNALNFLMPFVQPELGLSNTQVGILASALSLTWACAAFGIGFISDRTGSRKGLLILATLAFSACSFFSGLAGSFAALLGARLLMGAAEGGIMPISQAMIAAEVTPERRGLAMGVTQNFGSNLLGSFVAPVLLVAFATAYGWRSAFFLAGIPGILAALLMWKLIREPAAPAGRPSRATDGAAMTWAQAFAERNVLICAVMGVLLVSYLVVCWAFMPLYLTQVRGFDAQTMGWLMGTLGISATVGAFLVSGLSDRIGRRPLMIAMPFIGVILPLGAMYFDGSIWVLAAHLLRRLGSDRDLPAVHGDGAVGERRPQAHRDRARRVHGNGRDHRRRAVAVDRRLRRGSRRPAGPALDHARARDSGRSAGAWPSGDGAPDRDASSRRACSADGALRRPTRRPPALSLILAPIDSAR